MVYPLLPPLPEKVGGDENFSKNCCNIKKITYLCRKM